MSQPAMSHFKRIDARQLLAQGEEPLPVIQARVQALKAGEGLIVVAPFLPSPLIEVLGSQGFTPKCERGKDGEWIVYFWRAGA